MKKEDFKVGQTVYLRLIGIAEDLCKRDFCKRNVEIKKDDLIRKATVTFIGKSYLTVSPGYYEYAVNFNLTNFTEHAHDHKLFLTRQDAFDDIEKDELIKLFSTYNFSDLSVDALREIKKLLVDGSNMELTESDIRISDEVLVENDELDFSLETWFDVDAKFGLHTRDNDEWVNLYARINPETNHVRMVYFVESDTKCEEHEYHPTANETALILRMAEEYVKARWGQTLKEYYEGSREV